MTRNDRRQLLSLSLLSRRLGKQKKGSAFQLLPSLQHSRRRSGCSPAEPYLPHECWNSNTHSYPPLVKGTFLFCILGDISTLH